MWSQIDIKKYLIDKNKIIDKETYKKKKIVFSRYPLNNIDLYKPEQGRPVVLIRDPFDEISSSYFKYDRRPKEIRLKEINHKLLKSKIRAYEIYIKYWSDFASDPLNKNRFLFVNFKDLVENSETYLEKILKFYEYEINKEYIKKSVTVHSKENTRKNLLMIKEFNIKQRFADPEEKKILQKLIKDYFDKLLSETSIMKKYNYLKSLLVLFHII
ncbi:sulfotransferase [Candidatus Pelagibacter sp.]|nr:sulfotransferase [Candidatus Pelagibacter sp.]